MPSVGKFGYQRTNAEVAEEARRYAQSVLAQTLNRWFAKVKLPNGQLAYKPRPKMLFADVAQGFPPFVMPPAPPGMTPAAWAAIMEGPRKAHEMAHAAAAKAAAEAAESEEEEDSRAFYFGRTRGFRPPMMLTKPLAKARMRGKVRTILGQIPKDHETPNLSVWGEDGDVAHVYADRIEMWFPELLAAGKGLLGRAASGAKELAQQAGAAIVREGPGALAAALTAPSTAVAAQTPIASPEEEEGGANEEEEDVELFFPALLAAAAPTLLEAGKNLVGSLMASTPAPQAAQPAPGDPEEEEEDADCGCGGGSKSRCRCKNFDVTKMKIRPIREKRRRGPGMYYDQEDGHIELFFPALLAAVPAVAGLLGGLFKKKKKKGQPQQAPGESPELKAAIAKAEAEAAENARLRAQLAAPAEEEEEDRFLEEMNG